MVKKSPLALSNNSLIILILVLVYVVSVVFKFFYMKGAVGPAVIGDEILYRLYAKQLAELSPYNVCSSFSELCGSIGVDPIYPPVYPLFLAISGLFLSDSPLYAMKISNLLASSAVIFPVYGIARQFSGRVPALGAAIVSSTVPYQFVFPDAMLSENVSVTLTLVCFYFAISVSGGRYINAVLFGVSVAANALTKFAFLPVIPFALVIFAAKLWFSCESTKRAASGFPVIAKGLAMAGGAFLIPMAMWVAYSAYSGIPILHAFGFQPAFTGSGVVQQKSLYILFVYVCLQLASIIVASLPVLFPAMWFVFVSVRNRLLFNKAVVVYSCVFVCFSLFMWFFVSNYLWTTAYIFKSVLGIESMGVDGLLQAVGERYVIVNYFIFSPMAFAFIDYASKRRLSNRFYLAFCAAGVLFICGVLFCRNILYLQSPWPIARYITVSWPMAPNVVYGGLGIDPFWVAVVVLFALSVVVTMPLWGCRVKNPHVQSIAVIVFACGISGLTAVEGLKTGDFAWGKEYRVESGSLGATISKELINSPNSMKKSPCSDEDRVEIYLSEQAKSEVSKEYGRKVSDLELSYQLSYWLGRFVFVNSLEEIELMPNGCRVLVSESNYFEDVYTRGEVNGYKFNMFILK